MSNKQWLFIALAVLGGVVFAAKIRQLPVVGSKIPTV